MRPEKLTQFMTGKQTSVAIHTRLLTAFGLFLLVAIGIWLRFANLDNFGLDRNEDEDIMGIAVMGIAEYGEPRFPSGMVYLRSLPVSYMMAASTGLLGLNEIGLRAPSALFGTLLIILTFFLCRRYFGMPVALIAVFLVSVSFWQVEVSRTARMYAPYGALYLAAVYTACLGYIEARRHFQWLCLLLSILAALVHALGVVFGGVLLALALRPSQDWHARTFATINTALLGVVYLALPPMDTSHLPGNDPVATAPTGWSGRLADAVIGVLDVFVIPPFRFIAGNSASATLGLTIFGLAIAVYYAIQRRYDFAFSKATLAALGAVVLGAACHQFIISMLGVTALAVITGQQRFRLLIASCVLCLTAGLSWTLYGLNQSGGSVEILLEQFFGYPQAEQWLSFVEHRWIVATFGLIGFTLALRGAVAAHSLTAQSLLALVLAVTVLIHSILNSQFRPRYNFAVDSLFIILAAYGCWSLILWIARRSDRRAIAYLAPIFVILIALDLGAYHSFRLPNATEASATGVLGPHHDLRPDYRGAALYVREHLEVGDEVAATDWLTTYFYVGKVDYLLRGSPTPNHEWMQRTSHDGPHEIYLYAKWIDTEDSFKALLSRPCNSSLWIITSDMALSSPNKRLTFWKSIESTLERFHIHSGARQTTTVYRLPAPVCKHSD